MSQQKSLAILAALFPGRSTQHVRTRNRRRRIPVSLTNDTLSDRVQRTRRKWRSERLPSRLALACSEGLQGCLAALLALFSALILASRRFWETQRPLRRHSAAERPLLLVYFPIPIAAVHSDPLARLSTGC